MHSRSPRKIKEIIELQNELLSSLNVVKDEFVVPEPDSELNDAINNLIKNKVNDIVETKDKKERSNAKDDLIAETVSSLEETFPDQQKMIRSIIDDKFKDAFREQILSTGKRSDGRSTTDIREITVETGILPRTHGSALFTRGETQAWLLQL